MDFKLKETIIIEDAVPKDFQEKIKQTLIERPDWRFLDDMSYAKIKMRHPSYGFNMLFKHPHAGIVSDLYEEICVKIIDYIKPKINFKVDDIAFTRSFLQLPLDQKFIKDHNGIHVDMDVDHYACVYYVNDSDGDTIVYEQNRYDTIAGSQHVELKEHKRVTPKQGRMVLFDGARYHCSSQPKNGYRCIINFDLI